MMSLNRADELNRELEEKHDFNAEQANGTLLVVDEMVDNGIDRVLGSIESLRSEMDVRFNAIDKRFNTIDNQLKTIEAWVPTKSVIITLAILAAAFAIFGQ